MFELALTYKISYRYDGRGHLYDLRPYDADHNKGKYGQLSEEEQRVEALIDEERYLELHTDVAERAMYEGGYSSFIVPNMSIKK